jgi:predicted alpha/beta hydrolase family esterase
VSSADGAWICGTTEAAYRKRLSRARAAIREFVADYCGLVAPARARCHCRNRVAAAISLGRIDPHVGDQPSSAVIDAATAEMEALYDAAQLMRSMNDEAAPKAVAVRIRSLMRSSRYQIVGP